MKLSWQAIHGAFFLPLAVGCGPSPPSVRSAADVDRLAASTWSISARDLPDGDVASLGRLKQLDVIDFARGNAVGPAAITDNGLATLAKLDLPKLETLQLGSCANITDAGLPHLAGMTNIRWLGLAACDGITDAGLPALAVSTSLRGLDLRGNPNITDDGIQQLSAKKDWQEILLGGCPQITAKGVAELQAALPNVKVNKDDQEWAAHDR